MVVQEELREGSLYVVRRWRCYECSIEGDTELTHYHNVPIEVPEGWQLVRHARQKSALKFLCSACKDVPSSFRKGGW